MAHHEDLLCVNGVLGGLCRVCSLSAAAFEKCGVMQLYIMAYMSRQ